MQFDDNCAGAGSRGRRRRCRRAIPRAPRPQHVVAHSIKCSVAQARRKVGNRKASHLSSRMRLIFGGRGGSIVRPIAHRRAQKNLASVRPLDAGYTVGGISSGSKAGCMAREEHVVVTPWPGRPAGEDLLSAHKTWGTRGSVSCPIAGLVARQSPLCGLCRSEDRG